MKLLKAVCHGPECAEGACGAIFLFLLHGGRAASSQLKTAQEAIPGEAATRGLCPLSFGGWPLCLP